MPGSGYRLIPRFGCCASAIPLLFVGLTLLLAGCASHNNGTACSGQRETLSGQPLGSVEGLILDQVTSFTVTLPEMRLDSGPLWSSDRQLYIPSAVTANGWLAQRISDRQFSIINAPQDQMITFICPAIATH